MLLPGSPAAWAACRRAPWPHGQPPWARRAWRAWQPTAVGFSLQEPFAAHEVGRLEASGPQHRIKFLDLVGPSFPGQPGCRVWHEPGVGIEGRRLEGVEDLP